METYAAQQNEVRGHENQRVGEIGAGLVGHEREHRAQRVLQLLPKVFALNVLLQDRHHFLFRIMEKKVGVTPFPVHKGAQKTKVGANARLFYLQGWEKGNKVFVL
jgi:hypothetical protein